VALVGLAERREECPAAVDDAPDVDVEDPTEIIDGLLLEPAGRGHAGVVDEDVTTAVLLDHLGCDSQEAILVTHVSYVHRRSATVTADDVSGSCGSLLADVNDSDVGSSSRECFARGASDAAARAGHDGHSVGDRSHGATESLSTQRVPV
jgi:hypothetical protein